LADGCSSFLSIIFDGLGSSGHRLPACERQVPIRRFTPNALIHHSGNAAAWNDANNSAVIPGRASARTRNLEIPGSMLRIAPE
jgi:hypothetical protein